MEPILIFAIGVLAGILIAWWTRKGRRGKPVLVERQREEKDMSKLKILKAFDSRGRMANDSVMDLLGVSEATATRYLDELERDGRIRQLGRTGRGVYYEKI